MVHPLMCTMRVYCYTLIEHRLTRGAHLGLTLVRSASLVKIPQPLLLRQQQNTHTHVCYFQIHVFYPQ